MTQSRDTDFAAAVRDQLRGKPEAVGVGEIRDEGTLRACLEAASRGHVVWTTVCADAAASIPDRLAALGVASRA